MKRLLCPIDGSEQGGRALDAALSLARGLGATVVLFHAYHVSPDVARLADHVATGTSYLDRIRNDLRARSEAIVAAARARAGDVPLEAVHVEGAPEKAIVKAAAEHRCDAVVIGRRGLSGIRRALLGSISDYVVHHASVPVIVVP
jgi:nucleotide-binding universal stress UspA family protein